MSRRYWGHTPALAESFLECHPGSSFSVLTSDGSRPGRGAPDRIEVLDPADIGIDTEELHRRATMFVAQGLAGSMKPILWRRSLRDGAVRWCSSTPTAASMTT